MSRANKKPLSTASLLGQATQYLGIDGDGAAGVGKKRKKAALSRKDKRKQERQHKKETKQHHSKLRAGATTTVGPVGELKRSAVPLKRPEESMGGAHAECSDPARKKRKHSTTSDRPSSMLDPEDEEIARLEKLLGLKKDEASRRKVAAKLNKEYEQFEGLGDDFGDFLLGLDEIAKSDKPRKKRRALEDSDSYDGPEISSGTVPDLIDDDEFPESDVSYAEEGEGEDDFSDEEENENEYSGESQSEEEGSADESDRDVGGRGRGSSEHSSDEEEEATEEEDEDAYYAPTSGQDIYGNIKDAETAEIVTGKYIPPALRNKQAAASVINESSEKYILLRRVMNGLLNRLSDDSKDSIIRSLKELFDTNSHLECCHCLNKCIMTTCNNSTQIMITLIPLYAAVVAALHMTVGISVGANLLELLATTLHKELHQAKDASRGHALIGNKYASNMLLIIMFLYSLRVVHHSLLVGILDDLSSLATELCKSPDNTAAYEMVIELLVAVVENVGTQLNGDEPSAIRTAVVAISDATKHSAAGDNKRVQYMLDAVAELKSSKSKRSPSPIVETVARLRKWLGTVKTALGSKPGDLCLHITLEDFLQAEVKGRWWRAGAAWTGRTSEPAEASKLENRGGASRGAEYEQKSSAATSTEHSQLLQLAAKMRMNTPVRRDIFVVMMGSMDPLDAYERLLRLDLRGKQDREIIKVLMECCGQEKSYNSFYSELGCILSEQNRQHKSTFQFAFWDAFKTLSEGNFSDRRAINLARLLGSLVSGFHVSLSILKVLDMSELSDRMILFLATLFLSIFSSKVPDDTFTSIFDRVATTADFDSVKDVITFFLQKYFTEIPHGLDAGESKVMQRRRKQAIKIMSEMSVLDVARAKMEEADMK